MTEGLLGQGLRVRFLITTNEELGKLNPAVTRAGRCLSEIEFRSLNPEEGNQCLQNAGCDRRLDGSHTLSDLYAILRGNRETWQPQLGFCPALDSTRDGGALV